MFGWAIFRFKMGKLQREMQRISRAYDKDLRKARARKAPQVELDEIQQFEMMDADQIYDEIFTLQSSRLLGQATLLDIPLPDLKSKTDWEESRITRYTRLTTSARHNLRTSIEVVHKARREALTWWVPIIFGVAGMLYGFVSTFRSNSNASLVAAINGLAAVLKTHH
jgi:hypothetical protein